MKTRRVSFFVVAGVAFALYACTQGEGERCEVPDDCGSSMLCVNQAGVLPNTPPAASVTDPDLAGHCCPPCDTGRTPRWDSAADDGKGDCTCRTSTITPPADGGPDGGGSTPDGSSTDGEAAADGAEARDASQVDGADGQSDASSQG